jgi:WD40 repeat protein
LISGCEDRHVRIHDGGSLATLHEFPPLTSIVRAVAADGRCVAAGDNAGEVRIWRLDDQEPLLHTSVRSAVRELAFDATHRRLLGLAHPARLFAWDPLAGSEHEIELALTAPDRAGATDCLGLQVERGLVGVASSAAIQIVGLDGTRRARLFGRPFDATNLAVSPEGDAAVTAHADGRVRIWSFDRPPPSRRLDGPGSAVQDLCFDPVAPRLFASGANGKVVVHELCDATTRRTELDTGQGPVGLALSPDGRVLATVRREKGPDFMKQWQADTLAFSWSTDSYVECASGVEWSRNGRMLAFAIDSGAMLWCGAHAEEGSRPFRRTNILPMRAVAFAPSSDRFATLDETGDLRIWRAADGQSLLEVRAHESKGKALAWSPDGRLLATGGCDQSWAETSVRLYDAESGARLGEVRTRSWVITLAFSPDSRRLCFCGGDAYVRLLDVRSCEPVLSIKTDNVVTKLAFSADGRYLAAGDTAGAIQLWWARNPPKDARSRR